jgi:transcriptional regulator with XRE-family HTH domain
MLRQQMGMSLQDMADASGLTKSYLSKVERGICVPSIAAAIKISTALKVDVGQLFSPQAAAKCFLSCDTMSACASSERLMRAAAWKPWRQKSTISACSLSLCIRPVSCPTAHAAGHAGEEFLYVLTGSIEIQFPDHREQLKKGDAIYFNALLPHCLRSAGKQQASALVVISYDQG